MNKVLSNLMQLFLVIDRANQTDMLSHIGPVINVDVPYMQRYCHHQTVLGSRTMTTEAFTREPIRLYVYTVA